MLDFLIKLFTEQLTLSADLWLIALTVVVVLAFLIPLIMGLVTGAFSKIKGNMKRAVQKPSTAVVQMKNMPAGVKALYKTARMSNAKPSALVTQAVCVDEPYKHSLVSKVWLTTLIATVVCAALAYFTAPLSAFAEDADAVVSTMAEALSPIFVLIVGGLLTLVGGIVCRAVYGGAVKTYAKFAPVIDGDGNTADHMAQAQAQQQQTYEPQAAAYAAEPVGNAYAEQPAYEAQAAYEPQADYAAEPVGNAYAEQPAYEEPVAVVANEPQESDEEIRRRAREEAMAQARAAQQQAQAQAQAKAQPQPQPKPQQQAAASGGTSTADDVIAQIEKISREGAPRETMRDVATLLQKERAKPENKTPEQQKRLNEALSKLLKAMSAATKK